MAAACNHAQFTAECHECVAAVPAPVGPPTCPRHPLYVGRCPLCVRERDVPAPSPADDEPLRVEIPAPTVPVLGRVRAVARHCCHREDGQHCERCADLRAGEARLRAVSEIPAILARTPSAVEVMRALADSYEYEARHSQERARAVGAGESQREHEQLAAEHAAVAEVLRVVLSLVPHTPTVAPKTEGQGVP